MAHPGKSLRDYIQIGDVLIDRYRVEDTVGAGAFGAIYSAIDLKSGERVAVKALPPEGDAVSDTALARFRREMKVISNLIHRNIVGLYDFEQTDDGVFFMILEYVDGRPLDLVAHGHAMTSEQVISVCEQIASALVLAHHRGVIHRDLKPANIMLTDERDGYGVKVLDFGMAKLLRRLDDDSIDQLTREGMAVGTPRYIAPEQARGEQVGAWTDLYALGLLMYEMLTGARAVKADDVEGAVSAHVSPEPLALAELDQVPAPFRPVLFRLIEKDPRKRYRSADDLLADLDKLRYEVRPGAGGAYAFDPRRGRVEQVHAGQPAAPPSQPVAPPPSESRRRTRARQPAEQAQPAEAIDLDYDAYDRHATPQRDPARAKRKAKAPSEAIFRLPEKPLEWIEACISPVLALFAFMLFTAQLRSFDYVVRLGLGLAPTVLALVWSLLSGRGSWRYSFFRLSNLFSLAALLVAHAMGPSHLITALFRNPTWFLTPIEKLPGMDLAKAMLTWVARRYAEVLSTFIDTGTGMIS